MYKYISVSCAQVYILVRVKMGFNNTLVCSLSSPHQTKNLLIKLLFHVLHLLLGYLYNLNLSVTTNCITDDF